jgi:molybdopterin molybdotransferase
MNIDFYSVATLEKTREIIRNLADLQNMQFEKVDVDKALGRYIAYDSEAAFNLPEFNRSTVDGYAIIANDIGGASETIPSIISIIGEVHMGEHTHLSITSSQGVYVPTGGMLPEGADAVVMIEYVEKLDDTTLLVYSPVSVGENISYIGDDLKSGDQMIRKGTCLSPYDLGLLVGMGISHVDVLQPIKVSVISTGDEIIDLDKKAFIGQVFDINGYAIAALINEIGGTIVQKEIIPDNFERLREGILKCLEESDCIILSGGSSAGMRDYTKDLIESFPESKIYVHGLAIKPGKPTILGTIGNTIVFGLPGHPVSALMVFDQLVGYYFEYVYSIPQEKLTLSATLTNNVHGAPGRETFQMVRLEKRESQWFARPIYAKSGMMSLLAHTSGYFIIPMNKEGHQQGEIVEVYLRQGVRLL